MNNLYHRFAIASVGIALGFALGTNKEARAATFSFTSTSFTSTDSYFVIDYNQDGVVDFGNSQIPERYAGIKLSENYTQELGEYRSSYRFNIASLFFDSNTRIISAIFQTKVTGAQYFRRYSSLKVYGYTEEQAYRPFDNGEYLDQVDILSIVDRRDKIATFNVLPFIINQKSENNDSFWLGVRPEKGQAFVTLPTETSLTITTSVPEPTTIFGSAIGLCLGGWLKRRKSAIQNKINSQN